MKRISIYFMIACVVGLFGSCGHKTNKSDEIMNPIYVKPVEKNEHWHNRVETFEHDKDSLAQAHVIFLGNSITEGYDLSSHFPDCNVINRGVSSDHIDGLIDRLDVCLNGESSAKVFVMIGINDIGAGRSEAAVKYLYRKLVDEILNRGNQKIYLQSILPTSSRWDGCSPETIINVNNFIEALAKEKGLTYVQSYRFFLKKGSLYADSDLFIDGLHPNAKGYSKLTECLVPFVYGN